MKQNKIFRLMLALVLALCAWTTANADVMYSYQLTVGTHENCNVSFKVGTYNRTSANAGEEVTITVTPTAGYITNTITVKAFMNTGGMMVPRRAQILEDVAVTTTDDPNVFTITMPAADIVADVTTAKIIQDSWIEAIADQAYTGSAIKPAVTVKDGSTTLEQGTDYTVSYSNNTNAALSTAENAPAVTVTGTGAYSGTTTKTFTITAKEVTLTWSTDELVYSGSAQAPTATVGSLIGSDVCTVTAYTGQETNAGTGYTVTATALSNANYKLPTDATHTYSITRATPVIMVDPIAGAITYGQTLIDSPLNGGSAIFNDLNVYGTFAWTNETIAPSVSNSGTTPYEVRFTPSDGANLNSTTTTITLPVNPASLESATVTLSQDSYDYTGTAIQPTVSSVILGGVTLTAGTDYTVSYSNNTNAALSTAENAPTVTITGTGNYTGTATKTFTINKAAATISYTMTAVSKAFGNAAFTNALTKDPATGTGLGTVTYAVSAETLGDGCTSTHVATVNESTGQVTITGFGTATITATVTDGTNYTYSGMTGYNEGTHSASVSYDLTVSKGTITASASNRSYTYNGYSHSITVSVSKPSSGYTIQYSTDNSSWSSTKPGRTSTGSTTIYYKVTAPNYNDKTGSATVTITRATGSISFSGTEVEKTYGDANFIKTYSSKKGNGSITYSSNNTSVATVTNSGEVTIQGAGTAIITVNMAFSTNYTSASATYTLTVNPADLSGATVMLNPTQTTFEYDGDAKEPAVMFVILGGTKILTAGTDYTVSYTNNVNAGAANDANAPTAVVTGIGNYTGEATTAFTITPKTTTNGNITIEDGGNTTELTVTDMGNQPGNTLPDNLEVTILNYYRTLNENDVQAYTVCLPYAPLTSSDLTYYTLADCDGTTLSFQEISGAPQANTPYLVLASATTDIGQQDVHGVTMSKEVPNSSSAGGYVFKGTLSGFSHSEAIGLYILQAGNRWGRVGSDTHAYIPPFRAYIEATSTARPNSLDSTLGDEATGIQQLRTVDNDGTERWFDLQGHRIAKPAKGGVYIHNGKKVVNGK